MNSMTFDLNKYENGVGSIFACQYSMKLFIEDVTNDFTQRKHAETIYEWLGVFEGSIDELCAVSYDKSVFILNILEKYEINTSDSNLLLNHGYAVDSLKYQINLMLHPHLKCKKVPKLFKSKPHSNKTQTNKCKDLGDSV